MSQSLPIITGIPGIQQWQQVLKTVNASPQTPKIPWQFKVKNQQGGNYLTWQAVTGADGYIVDISANGDFSTTLSSKNLLGNNNITLFDSIPTSNGATPAIRYYRVRATAGTVSQPQSVSGLPTGVLSSTAIAPNDTTTSPTTSSDSTTSDRHQAGTGSGNYRGRTLPKL